VRSGTRCDGIRVSKNSARKSSREFARGSSTLKQLLIQRDFLRDWRLETWSRFGFELSFLFVRRTITKSTWAEIRTAYASGIGLREIARNMGVSEGTVLSRAKRECWTREIQNAKALAKRKDALPAVTPVQALAASMQQRGERHLGRMANIIEKTVPHIEAMEPSAILDRIDDVETLDKIGRRTYGLKDIPPTGFTLNVLNMGSLDVQVNDGTVQA
jgi:hypothetical protein